MTIHHDEESGTASVLLSDAPPHESSEVAPGVIVDYDADGNVLGVEVLGERPNPAVLAILERDVQEFAGTWQELARTRKETRQ